MSAGDRKPGQTLAATASRHAGLCPGVPKDGSARTIGPVPHDILVTQGRDNTPEFHRAHHVWERNQ